MNPSKEQLKDQAKTKIIAGVFSNLNAAEAAVAWLFRKSFRSCEISILFPEDGARSTQSLLSIGSLSYLRHLHIPTLGEFVCGGPIATILANWSLGGYSGEMIDRLEDLGIAESQAQRYVGYLKNEKTFLYVQTNEPNKQDEARQIFSDAGAEEITASHARDLKSEINRFDYQYGDEKLRDREAYRPLA